MINETKRELIDKPKKLFGETCFGALFELDTRKFNGVLTHLVSLSHVNCKIKMTSFGSTSIK